MIPLLPFGRERAVRFTDAAVISERLTESGAAKLEYIAAKSQPLFEMALSEVRAESFRMVAAANSAMQFSASDFPKGVIIIPLAGSTITRSNGTWIEWGRGQGALYLPPGGSRGESKARLAVAIDVEAGRLQDIARAMAGPDLEEDSPLDLEAPRALGLGRNGVDFECLFQQHFALVNAMGGDPASIERSGLDEMILRAMVMLLAPSLLFQAGSEGRNGVRARVSQICDYIDANLTRKITLTELEKLSGLSARSLQYSFQTVMGRTPTRWIIERRLEVVHQKLLSAQQGETVTSIAGLYFSNMGEFARMYKARYGELPSETIGR
ncbi:AraC-like DNA-binding protein [Aquabacter spiritensis]|uniref:AraC-like DNA-binding protein n=2 Tax=Aquabacter spiritensis TaxID=933073 RepID=A0A4R3LUP8_9HYPH|nr:AraC-like DNA-binding protein [Aquabacter spiritensis]